MPDRLSMLPGTGFEARVRAVPPDVLARSTWEPGCPVTAADLSWVRLTFWGFDDQRHTGELLVNASVADDLVQVFGTLYEQRFPLEELRITTAAELDAAPTGDGNVTGAFVCRPTTGSTTTFSQHAYAWRLTLAGRSGGSVIARRRVVNGAAVVALENLFGFRQELEEKRATTAMTMIDDAPKWAQPAARGRGGLLDDLDRFRTGLYSCLTRRRDALFELADAVSCGTGPVRDLAHLSLEEPYQRGHGALYDALNAGSLDLDRLRTLLAGLALPRFDTASGPRIVLAVDVSNWLRPDAATSPQRLFCHTYARGRGQAQMIPGWPYSFVAVLEPGASSWTTILDVTRLGPSDNATTVTASQLRGVIERLIAAGQWQPGDPKILIVGDAGYDGPRLAWLLRDLPVTVVVRVRSDRIFHSRAGKRAGQSVGRPPRHGPALKLPDPATWPAPDQVTTNTTDRYGTAVATAFDQMHPRLAARGAWTDHKGDLPIIEGTLIQLAVEHLPGDRNPKPLWLWASTTGATSPDIDHYWSMFCRRFDLEHTFRFLKQTLGWTRPMLRDPHAADRWTWLILTAHAQLRLARPVAADHRLPWQRPLAPTALTPARVRASYRHIHAKTAQPTRPPKPSHAGPGRPKGRKNRVKAPIQPVGKS